MTRESISVTFPAGTTERIQDDPAWKIWIDNERQVALFWHPSGDKIEGKIND